jgi:hypothetical protein
MRRCIAFVPQGRTQNGWRPCRQAAAHASVFCRRHETVFAGAMLGVCIHSYPAEMEELRETMLKSLPVASRKPS